MNFKERVLSMKPSEIIMAMVKGLRKRHAKIDMSNYGKMKDGVCYGCAATNCILEIDKKLIKHYENSSNTDREIYWFIDIFESAINQLRYGDVEECNNWFIDINLGEIISKPGLKLPCLNNDFTEEDLLPYIELAKYNKSLNN